MTIRFVALLSAACVALAAPAAQADPVRLPFRAEIGTTWTIHETSTRQAGGPISSGELAATLKVVGETKDGFVMEWTTSSAKSGGAIGEILDPALLLDTPIRFEADQLGMATRILGAEALADQVSRSASDKDGARFLKGLLASTPPASVVQQVLAEAVAIGACQGFALEPGKVVSNKLDDIVLTVELQSAGSDDEPARIRQTQTVDLASRNAAISKALGMEKAGQKLGPVTEEAIAALSPSIEKLCRIDRRTGDAVAVEMTIVTGGTVRIEETRKITTRREP